MKNLHLRRRIALSTENLRKMKYYKKALNLHNMDQVITYLLDNIIGKGVK